MTKFNKIIVFIIILTFSGCVYVGTKVTAIAPQLQMIDMPKLNEENVVEVGETIISKGKAYVYDAIVLKNEVARKTTAPKVVIPPGVLVAKKQDKNYTYYFSEEASVKKIFQKQSAGIRIAKNNSEDMKLFFGTDAVYVINSDSKPIVEFTKEKRLRRSSFQQELIYNGKSGSSIKFLYRELKDSYLRPAFSQEVQYDLNEGKVIGFKGARIEIAEATNVNLTYKVLKSFPDF